MACTPVPPPPYRLVWVNGRAVWCKGVTARLGVVRGIPAATDMPIRRVTLASRQPHARTLWQSEALALAGAQTRNASHVLQGEGQEAGGGCFVLHGNAAPVCQALREAPSHGRHRTPRYLFQVPAPTHPPTHHPRSSGHHDTRTQVTCVPPSKSVNINCCTNPVQTTGSSK